MALNAKPMETKLPPERITSVTGFGLASIADGYLYRPTTIPEIKEVFDIARKVKRKVVLRGAGRSYGDASIAQEALILDLTRFNQILDWNSREGVIEVQGGVTIEDIWRYTLEDGWWLPVVSGTMAPTIAGALAMNIHGKNNYCAGTLGEHVLELDVLSTSGELHTITPVDELFDGVISGAGLLGIITRVKLQMKRVNSGNLRVVAHSLPNWDEAFAAFSHLENEADYMVAWIDCFAKGKSAGRGLFHAAWYMDEPGEKPASLLPENQDLPDTIMGRFPKATMWRWLKRFNNHYGMRLINSAKYHSSRILGNGKTHTEGLIEFSFLLDYVPNWRKAYLPGGFIQYQAFVPRERAYDVFSQMVEMQHQEKIYAYLGVMKRHRKDNFMFSHGVDGYSLALDFKVTNDNWKDLQNLCNRMNKQVIGAQGKFYFAKDSTLKHTDLNAYLPQDALQKFYDFRHRMDPESLLTSGLAQRLGLG